MARELNETAGKRVTELLERRGLTLRAADRKTGVNYGTISNMSIGHRPEMESVVRFAKALGENVNEWLELYGYPPVETPLEVFWDGLVALRAAHPELEIPYPKRLEGVSSKDLTLDLVRRVLSDLEEEIAAGSLLKRQNTTKGG